MITETADGRFTVRLTNFEGPFDLLLQLIGRHKLDVTEIALSTVTDEFIAHLRALGDELASHRAAMPTAAPKQPSRPRAEKGRTRHEEKITVYCSADELLALETARLTLRGQHGVAADRGRIVREAIAVLLADLEVHGEESVLVRRLRK